MTSAAGQRLQAERRRRAVAVASVILLLGAAVYLALTAPRTIFEADSEYGGVRVAEHRSGLRTLHTRQGRAVQSAVLPGRPMALQLEYTRAAAIGLALVPDTGRILYVGLGAGAMPMHASLVLPRALIDVVEIDPLVVDVAQRHLGFRSDERLRVHVADGRAFIDAAPTESWDLIVMDAYSDDEVPAALATQEFLELARSRLREDGAVVANLWMSSPQYEAMLATYAAAFGDVHLVRVGQRAQNILIAHPAPGRYARQDIIALARRLRARSDPGFDLAALVAAGYHRPAAPRARVLRDAPAADDTGFEPTGTSGTPPGRRPPQE